MHFGAHMSTGGGVWKALERGKSVGCESIQIFVKSNMRWYGTGHSDAEIKLFSKGVQEGNFRCVFGHTGYLINLGAPASANRDHSIKSLVQEIEFADKLGLPFLVMHPGAHLGTGEKPAFSQIVSGLNDAFAATRKSKVRIALENTAGQGTCLGAKVEHLAEIFDTVDKPERLGICLDTAHMFAAGYDIRTRKGWETFMKQVNSLVGLDQILAFHLNDSKTDLGSRVDRHAHIGEGKIGREAFRHIVNDARFKNHPACLETPKEEDLKEDVMNLTTLRSLLKKSKSSLSKTL